MLEKINATLSFIKEIGNSQNLSLNLSATIAFGCGLLLLWYNLNISYFILTILTVFFACTSVGLIIKNIKTWRKDKNKRKEDQHIRKLGLLCSYQYTYKTKNPWPDRNFNGLGWIICVNNVTRSAYLQNPICLECKTDLIAKANSKCNGFYLECPDCEIRFDVDHIGETRHLADASLQGDIRKNPEKYFMPTRF